MDDMSADIGGERNRIDYYEFMVTEDRTHVGLVVANTNGDRIIVPFGLEDALRIGAGLIAHSDYCSGRPIRDWSTLTA